MFLFDHSHLEVLLGNVSYHLVPAMEDIHDEPLPFAVGFALALLRARLFSANESRFARCGGELALC